MAHRRRSFSGTRTPRKVSAWDIGFDFNTNITASALTLPAGLAFAIDNEATWGRMHGEVQAQLTTTVAGVNQGFKIAMGIGVVPTSAFAAGAASCPDPLLDIGWEGWMYHRMFNIRAVTSTLSDGVNANSASFREVIDVKAMRKMSIDETLIFMISSTLVGTSTMAIKVLTRSLLLLS